VLTGIFIVGALLTAIFAYMTGVIDFDKGRTATIEEFSVMRSEAYVDSERTANSMSRLALSQIRNGLYIQAEATIQEGFALNAFDEERNQGLLFAHATLAHIQDDEELAIERFEEVMRRLREDFDRVFNSDIEPNWAQGFGMHSNYYESAISLSFLYHTKGEYEKQIEMLDIAAEGLPTMADVFLFRGQARLAQGDSEGAIADFNEVLRFIPDDTAALAGLEEAGGATNE